MDPLEVVTAWQERAWGEGDLSAVDDFIADEYTRHGPTGTAVRTPRQVKEDLRQYQRVLHKPKITIHDRTVDGDKVWSRVEMDGANLDTGERQRVHWMQLHRVTDGRIAEVWSLYTNEADWPD